MRKKAEDVIEKCKRDINPDPVPEEQQPEPEEAAGNKEAVKTADDEKNEVAPVQQPQAPEDHGEENKLSDEELSNMYFKQGMAVKAISEKTGLGPSGLYKRLEKMKKSIENNAKEYARQIR